jgi:pimeloyl-ACP methyl ester carboxylesterase
MQMGYRSGADGETVAAKLPGLCPRDNCCAALVLLVGLLVGRLCPAAQAMQADCPAREAPKASLMFAGGRLPGGDEAGACTGAAGDSHPGASPPQLIVIGFMGGRVKAGNLVHREALLAKELRESYPHRVYAAVFANHDAQRALKTVLELLDANRDGGLSAKEKSAARIVIYGHSWGGSETVALARRLNELNIPVLLTVQVDSVQKPSEMDGRIPPNVREAVNFYQSEGLLHGRPLIEAMDPKRTTILGNYESSYRKHPISCADYPWFARAFMKAHIEIENDPSVWARIAALIRGKLM